MYSICRQTHPATGIEFSVSCCFFEPDEACLVTAGANVLKVFRLMPEGHSKEYNAAGQCLPPKMKLECCANYTLWGSIMSLVTVKNTGGGRDMLLVSFKEAKLSVVQYDPASNDLITLSMHYLEEDDMKGGWTQHTSYATVRADPENRCAVMLVYGRRLAVLPFRRDLNQDEGDCMEAKPLDIKNPMPTVTRAPILASYVINLKDLDEKIDNVVDIQFLHGYYEPTLLILYEPVKTFAGRIAVRNDTKAMVGVSLNSQQRVHPIIWTMQSLPFDCFQAVAVPRPLGGCLILAVNSLIYLNQSVPPYGVSLNSASNNSTNFPLRIQEGVCVNLENACIALLGEGKFALSLSNGQLYVLTLMSDSVRTVRAFHLERAAASVLTCTMCVIEEDFLFLGSRLGNSLLLRVTERDNRLVNPLDRTAAPTVDLTIDDEEAANAAKKRKMAENLEDCIASNVIEITDDELEVYGSDVRTNTQLTSFVFEVCDSLLNIGPIGEVCMGEPQLLSEEYINRVEGPLVELVCASGHGKNGALTVLQRSIRPQLITTFNLPGCIDMWTVYGESGEETDEATHAYLLLTQEESTMVLQTGREINEVESSGFMTNSPTIYAGNLGNNKYMVQVTTTAIRLIKNGVQLQAIPAESYFTSACACDPYISCVSGDGSVCVYALRDKRLLPARRRPASRPAARRAALFRDTGAMHPHATIKTEFTLKMMKGKKVKAEGFKEGAVYEIDDDEQLYGGDATPASMATIMLAEQVNVDSARASRRLSQWWRRYLTEHKPSYWLFLVRDNANMEIYSLPDMKLSFLIRDVLSGAKVLTDSLESVPIFDNPNDIEEEIAAAQGSSIQAANIGDLQEIAIHGLGNKGSRPLLIIRTKKECMIYQMYKYNRGNLKIRFSRMNVNFVYSPLDVEVSDSYEEDHIVKDNVTKIRYFGNIGGYNGIFICGQKPQFLFLTPRGELRIHPLDSSTRSFAPFNNANCPLGFLHLDEQSELHISVLPTHLSYDAPWPVRKVPLRVTPHYVTYHMESKTYCLVTSQSKASTSYYKFNGEDKELSEENKGERFPYPIQDKFSMMLFSPVAWEIIPNTTIDLDDFEFITCLKNVALSYEGTKSGMRGYIAVGTNYNYSEDITSRGRILIYDIIDVVPEPGQPLTKNRLKEVYAKEQKGPVTALAQVLGFLVGAIGQKIYLWQLKDDDLVGIAFIDTQIYVHKMLSIKNMILIADVYKSISLLRYQPQYKTLSLVSRDLRSAQIYDVQFMVDNSNLGFLVTEMESNFVLFMYQPHARESFGGQRLIRKADYHLGQQVNSMIRISAKSTKEESALQKASNRHVIWYATLDGGLGYILPIAERNYRRLLMLQNVMNNYCCHLAGLNPKSFRSYKSSRKLPSGPAKGILDGDLIHQFLCMPQSEQHDVAKKIGTKMDEIIADLTDIERLTSHF